MITFRRLLRAFGLAPYSQVRRLSAELLALDDAYKELHDDLEKSLWARYINRLKNDVHMSLSWFYTQHVKNVSLGTVVREQAQDWPYYPAAQMLLDKPAILPEKL